MLAYWRFDQINEMVAMYVPEGRKTEATLAQEVSQQVRDNSLNWGHIFGHNSAAKGPTNVRTRPSETRDQDLSDGTGPMGVESQKTAVISVQR